MRCCTLPTESVRFSPTLEMIHTPAVVKITTASRSPIIPRIPPSGT
jgi:hypothetical protein